jgi:CheY-like chemotaxis protein
MLLQGLILTQHREYAQAMRLGLLGIGDAQTRVDVELDSLRAMQLVPQQYELILLDAMLDAMDGLQLLLLLKQQAPATKFIVVSDSADETSRAQAYQNGADFVLERPRTAEALRTAVEAIRGLLGRNLENPSMPETQDGAVMALADIVQTRCLSGDSVLLLVRSQHQSGDIFIFRGEVYHAQYPGKSGEAAFYDMAHWDGGQLRIRALKLNHVPPRTIEVPYRELLAAAEKSGALDSDLKPPTGELLVVSGEKPEYADLPSVVLEAPPLEQSPVTPSARVADLTVAGETPIPAVNSHWKINLMGELVEGSQVAEPDRCAFITYFFYRKLADIAVTLEVDYFSNLTLLGPHLQQVLVADNLGVRHAVFDTAWTTEDLRHQYMQWCCEQSF